MCLLFPASGRITLLVRVGSVGMRGQEGKLSVWVRKEWKASNIR